MIILFVDDEPLSIQSYKENLEIEFCDYHIQLESNIDSAYAFLLKNHSDVMCIILDVMMESGEILKDINTHYGLITGVYFHDKIRKDFGNIPIMMFTNFYDEEIKRKIENNNKSLFLAKEDYLPFELTQAIKNFIDKK